MTRHLFLVHLITTAYFLTACSSLQPDLTLDDEAFNDTATVQQQVDPKTSTLPAYDITGGVWVKDQALMINKEFNFGMAMSIEGAGTAIAVGMRNNKNETLANTLAALPDLQLNRRLHTLLKQNGISVGTQRISVYGLLYGQPQAHLRTVVELYAEDSHMPIRYMDYSPWYAVDGDDSWTNNNGEKLWAYFDESLPRIVALIQNSKSLANTLSNEIQYTLKGGEAVQRGKGLVTMESSERIAIESTDITNTLVSLPKELVEISDIPKKVDLEL